MYLTRLLAGSREVHLALEQCGFELDGAIDVPS